MIDCEKHGIKFSTNGLCPDCPQAQYPAIPNINTIICGDALLELKKLPDEFVDLIITDPH